MKFAKRTKQIAGTGADAWRIHELAQARRIAGEDMILLSIGDPDFDTPPPIVDAAIKSLQQGDTHYVESAGLSGLREQIAASHSQRLNQPISADQVVILSGAQCALFVAAQCLFEEGDEIIIPEPMYVTYSAAIEVTGARIIGVPLLPEHGFHLDIPAIAAAITPRTRAIMLNTPHNPTGVVLTREELRQISLLCIEHDLWLLSDEVYANLVYEGEHISPAAFPNMAERSIVISSLSKSHAMTGWRLGWLIAPPALIEHVIRLTLCLLYSIPAFVQQAGIAAFTHALPELEMMANTYRRRRDIFCAELQHIPQITVHPPEGGMFLMVDIRATGLSGYAFAEALYATENISVLAGEAFGDSAAGHIRVSLTVEEQQLHRAAQGFKRCIQTLISPT